MNELKLHQGSFHRTTEADFRNMPNVRRIGKQHIIHGSLRKLDYLNVQNVGDVKGRTGIENKEKELYYKKVTVWSERKVIQNDKEVVIVNNRIPLNRTSFEQCQSVRVLIIGNGCDSDISSLEFSFMPNLERVEIGSKCFLRVAELHVNDCSKLRRLFIGDGSFTDITTCMIENNVELLELQLGGSAAISTPQEENVTDQSLMTTNPPEVINEEEPSLDAMGSATEDNSRVVTDSEDDKDQRVLKLASCLYLCTLMNRPAPSEESTLWKWILPWLQCIIL